MRLGLPVSLVALAMILGGTIFIGLSSDAAPSPLVPLVQPGPWPGVSGLVGYGARLWFVNSAKFVDHNSADVWSYDPTTGAARYERHLMSQDAGDPVVLNGLLYWPFEDPRFSAGRGEYLVTNGREWQWRILPAGQVFHVHAFAARGGSLFAATSAWRAGLQRSDDGGLSWRVVYDHPTPPGDVSRITTLAVLDGTLYAGLTAHGENGVKLLRLIGETLGAVPGWPRGEAVTALGVYRSWLYGSNRDDGRSAVWRTNGTRVERVRPFDGHSIRAFAAGPDTLWAVSARGAGGALWQSADGLSWTVAQRFTDAEPLAVAVYAGAVYVGTAGPGGRGAVWGPRAPAPVEPAMPPSALPSAPRTVAPERLGEALKRLDAVLADPVAYESNAARLRAALSPLASGRLPAAGLELARRLDGPFPGTTVGLFGGALREPAAKVGRWYLLWAIAASGDGRVPPTLIASPWTAPRNRSEKYLEPAPAAAWAAAELRQADPETLAALVARLGAGDQPAWLDGDLIGALTALTAERFGYDLSAWRAWWARRPEAAPMIVVPGGILAMGSARGEPAERPVHRVRISPFSIDRFEATNADFARFVAATGHRTDPERSGVGWHWDGQWREVKGADWRRPHGPGSSIEGLERHPVVQVSWNDARAYCLWRGKRLPSEAEWERAARGDGARTYPWGDEPPRQGERPRASYGSDDCCRADAGDGYRFTAPVGSFPAGRSSFGVEDMAGNVWEWVEDWFDPAFYGRSPEADPVNRTPTSRKVIRGGGWGNDPSGLRSTLRHANPPDIGLSMVGIRCAR